MANTDAPFGLQPIGPVNGNLVHIFPVATIYGTAIFQHDPIAVAATATSVACAALDGVNKLTVEVAVAGAAGKGLGSAIGIYDYRMIPLAYLPASTTGDGVVAGYVLVICDPNQLYLCQEDGDTTPIAAASAGLNCDLISTHTGNTLTGRSKVELDSNTVNTTATLMMKLIGTKDGDTVAAAYCRWYCKLNPAFFAANVAGT